MTWKGSVKAEDYDDKNTRREGLRHDNGQDVTARSANKEAGMERETDRKHTTEEEETPENKQEGDDNLELGLGEQGPTVTPQTQAKTGRQPGTSV